MLFQAIALGLLGALQVTEASSDDAVELNYFCTHIEGKDEQKNNSPIIMIHEVGFSWQSWSGLQQVIALKTGRRVCAVDLRNHGDSPWNKNAGISVMAKDIGYFLDQHNMTTVSFVGHGIGGKVAMHYTLQNPTRVDSIVVEDMCPNQLSYAAKLIYRYLPNYLKTAIKEVPKGSSEEEAREIIVDYLMTKLEKISDVPEKFDDATAKNLPIRCTPDGCEWKTAFDMLQPIFNNRSFYIQSDGIFHGPALFIYGTKSHFQVGFWSKQISKEFPKSRIISIKNAGHFLHGVYRKFDDEVLKFLENVWYL